MASRALLGITLVRSDEGDFCIITPPAPGSVEAALPAPAQGTDEIALRGAAGTFQEARAAQQPSESTAPRRQMHRGDRADSLAPNLPGPKLAEVYRQTNNRKKRKILWNNERNTSILWATAEELH